MTKRKAHISLDSVLINCKNFFNRTTSNSNNDIELSISLFVLTALDIDKVFVKQEVHEKQVRNRMKAFLLMKYCFISLSQQLRDPE